MARSRRLCESCGRKLEVGHQWHKLVVCRRCLEELSSPVKLAQGHQRFRNTRPLARAAVVIATALAMALVAAVIHEQRSPSHLTGRAVDSTSMGRRSIGSSRVDESSAAIAADLAPDFSDLARSRRAAATTRADTNASATVAGTVRLENEDGSLEPRAGLRVQLLRRTVRRPALRRCLASEAELWQAFSDTSTGEAPVAVQPQPDANAADDTPAPAEVLATALSRLRAAAESAPVETDAAAALQTLSDLALFNVPVFDDAADDATVREARTSSDGKYELPDVAPGDYYVHAQETRGASFIEWCLAVHVPGERRTIVADLDDKNAAVTRSGTADTASD